MKKEEKIKFEDLSGWLKAFVIIGWIFIIVLFLKDNPNFIDTTTLWAIIIVMVIWMIIRKIKKSN